jgi:hypothetical protein
MLAHRRQDPPEGGDRGGQRVRQLGERAPGDLDLLAVGAGQAQ